MRMLVCIFSVHHVWLCCQLSAWQDDKKPRTFVYARDKLLRSLDFRRSFGATEINPADLGETLTCGSLYVFQGM